MLNGHGDDIHTYGDKIISNFSSNLYYRTDISDLEAHLASKTGLIRSYPEPDGHSLTLRLAETHGIREENLCITNGATEAIYLIAQSFSGFKSSVVIPAFSEYEDACRVHNLPLSFIPENSPFPKDTEILWLCNPNNPTGKVYDPAALTEWIYSHPEIIVIIDQSYAFFSETPGLTPAEAIQYPNLILLHSMTKKYAIPGLRIGYITAHSALIKKINRFCMPWNVNALALEAGHFLLDHEETCRVNPHEYRIETERFRSRLSEIPGLTVFPTGTHFFLCRLKNKTAESLKNYLIKEWGILIRDAANFRGLDPHYFRLATQTRSENDRLTEALTTWVQLD